jgi:Domain of unknown function (DUF4328)
MPRHDLRRLTTVTQMLLVAQACVAVAAAIQVYLSGFAAENFMAALISLLQSLLFIAVGITFLLWTYRAKSNANASSARGLSYSPAMAVGSYFIPILNLGVPAQAMQELYKSSVNPRDWEAAPNLRMIYLWWFFWITSNIAGIAVMRFQMAEKEAPDTAIINMFSMASDIGTVAASLALIPIVRVIAKLQTVPAQA